MVGYYNPWWIIVFYSYWLFQYVTCYFVRLFPPISVSESQNVCSHYKVKHCIPLAQLDLRWIASWYCPNTATVPALLEGALLGWGGPSSAGGALLRERQAEIREQRSKRDATGMERTGDSGSVPL